MSERQFLLHSNFLFMAFAVLFTVADSLFDFKIVCLSPNMDSEAYTPTNTRLPDNNSFPYNKAKLNPTIQHTFSFSTL